MTDNEVRSRTMYCLTKKTPDENYDVYVGSTSASLSERQRCHRKDSLRLGNEGNKLYVRMRQVGLDSWKIVPLLTLECTRDEIRAFERKWVEVLEANLNSISPMTTAVEASQKQAEYRENNHEEISRQKAEYYASNRDEICRKHAEYRANNR